MASIKLMCFQLLSLVGLFYPLASKAWGIVVSPLRNQAGSMDTQLGE